jgi:hypothetical protein
MYQTSEQVIEAAQQLKERARRVTNRQEHASFWDRKVDLYNEINSSLESGGLSEQARADLFQAKSILAAAEAIAGRYSQA